MCSRTWVHLAEKRVWLVDVDFKFVLKSIAVRLCGSQSGTKSTQYFFLQFQIVFHVQQDTVLIQVHGILSKQFLDFGESSR